MHYTSAIAGLEIARHIHVGGKQSEKAAVGHVLPEGLKVLFVVVLPLPCLWIKHHHGVTWPDVVSRQRPHQDRCMCRLHRLINHAHRPNICKRVHVRGVLGPHH